MSELKVYVPQDGVYGLVPEEGGIPVEEETCYLKSEADKVITEKDETIDKLKERNDELRKATESAWSKVNSLYDELRHQKYKRCLAMDKWCDAEADVADADGDYEDMRWYQKWHKRWLAIAEKFKEAK